MNVFYTLIYGLFWHGFVFNFLVETTCIFLLETILPKPDRITWATNLSLLRFNLAAYLGLETKTFWINVVFNANLMIINSFCRFYDWFDDILQGKEFTASIRVSLGQIEVKSRECWGRKICISLYKDQIKIIQDVPKSSREISNFDIDYKFQFSSIPNENRVANISS